MTCRAARRASLAVAALVPLHACASTDGGEATPASAGDRAVTAERCRVDLHGKGDTGAAPRLEGGIAVLTPTGNGEGWGGREWRYGERDELDEAIATVRAAIDDAGCVRVAVHGFSNGAAFAAAMICSGETFDGRLVGVLIDDPVTDAGTQGCARPDDVPIEVLWTGALDSVATAGTACADVDWTCSGDVVRGIEAYVADLGIDSTPSPNTEHLRHDGAPQPAAWLGA